MANTIQVKRGANASIPTLNSGEFGFSTDTKQIYIGDGAENYELASVAEVNTISGSLQTNIDSHASNHIDGTDDIQNATNSQKGLATASQITDIEANTAHKTSTGADHSYIDQTVVSGTDPTFIGTNITEIPSANVHFNVIGTPTYKTAQDWFDVIQSSGILEGFVLSNSRLSTELDVSAGKGIIKETDSELGATVSFETSAVENITLTSDNTNYIYVDYNAGTPQIVATTDRTSIELNRMFIIGRTYKNGADLYILNAGVHISNLARSEHERLVERDGFTYTSGSVTSETGTLNLDITAGVWYLGHNRVTTDPLNSDTGGDTWVYTHYGAASWITDNATTSAVDCTHYNAGTDALGTLGTNNYGTQWIYITADSHWYIIYGTQNGQLTAAEDASPPTSIPTYIETMGELIAKMIVKQDGTIVDIQSVHAITFTPAGITNHNETGGIQGGTANEYYHLTSAQHVDLTDSGDCSIHKHDDLYYTESEVNTISGSLQTNIDGKSDTGHSHTESDISNLDKYTQSEVDTISGSLNTKIDGTVLTDGSKILTSDWDIGDGRKILADEIRARDAAGLKLYDDGGNGIFVEDGGSIKIGTEEDQDVVYKVFVESVSGTADSFTYAGRFENVPENATARSIGLYGQAQITDSSITSGYTAGIEGRAISTLTSPNSVNYIIGAAISAENRDSGTCHVATGARILVTNYTGSGTITSARGIDINFSDADGEITTAYGVYLQEPSATTSFGIYQVGSDVKNYFEGNVGIGTDAPGAKLEVYETTNLGETAGDFQIISEFTGKMANENRIQHREWLYRDADGGTWDTARLHDAISIDTSFGTPGTNTKVWWERDPKNDIQSWGTGASTYMIINNGNVGIGTDAPGAKLEIYNGGSIPTISPMTQLAIINSAADQDAQISIIANSAKQSALQFGNENDENIGIITYKHSTNSFAFRTNAVSDRMVIDNSGNVGIGTADPDQLIHAEKSSALTNTVQPVARISHITSDTPAAGIGVGIEFEQETSADNNEVIAAIEAIATDVTGAAEDGAIVFKTMTSGTTATEKMRVDSDGNLIISGTVDGVDIAVFASDIQTQMDGKSATSHTHDERYYTEGEVDTISGSLQTNIDGKSDTGHTHVEANITDLDKYTQEEVDAKWTTWSGTIDHDTIVNTHNLTTDIDHDQLTNFSADEHRVINDSAGDGATTELWSADKVFDELATKSDAGHSHTESDISNLDKYTQSEVDTISGSLSSEIDTDIATHTSNADAHHNESHTVVSHSDTTATGANLNELVGAGDTTLHKHDGQYYTETEVDTISGSLNTKIDGKSDTGHTHDDRYYTETELDAGQLDNRYYTESEVDTISGSLNTKIDGKIANLSEDSTPDLGGQLGVGEHGIKFDSSLSADGKYSGETFDGVLGATFAFGDLVYLNTTDKRWELTNADAEATSGDVDLAIVLAAGNDGDTRLLLKEGFIRENDWNFTSYGKALYVSTTAGDMTQNVSGYTTGDIVRVVGYASTFAAQIHFKPGKTWLELL